MPMNQNYGVSNIKLKFALWYTRHKIFFRRAGIIILAGLTTFLYGYSIWGVIDIFIFNKTANNIIGNLAAQNPEYGALREKLQPKSVKIQKISVLPSGEERADVIVSIKNPNEKYAATEVLYRAVSQGNTLAQDSTFLFPLEEKNVAVFGIGRASEDIQFIIDNVFWRRVSDSDTLKKEKLDIGIFGELFDDSSRLSEGPSGVVRFQVKNNTIYNFYKPGFYIFLLNGQDVIRAVFTRLDILESLEKETVEVNIVSPALFVTGVEVMPEINIFDESAFITQAPEKEERELLIKPKAVSE